MLDNLESAGGGQEEPDIANPNTSDSPQDELTSDGQDIQAIVRDVLREELTGLDTRIERTAQSVKDRRFAGIEQRQDEQQTTLERIEELVGSGVDFRTAKTQAENEDRFRYIDNLRYGRPSPTSEDGNPPPVSNGVDTVLELAGLSPTDPRVQSALANKTGTDALLAAVELGKKIKNQPPASTAQISASPAGSPPQGDYADMTDDQLGERLSNLANQDPRFSRPERTKIRAELERRSPIKKLER